MPQIYVHTSDPVALNSYLVLGEDSGLVIDTGAGPTQAGRILAAWRALTSHPLHVVNTHDHWDHFFGNARFAQAGVSRFLSSARFAADQAGSAWVQLEQVPLEAEPDLPPPDELIVPTEIVHSGDTLDLGGCHAEFLELTGHSTSDLVVVCGGIAFVGDLLEEGAPPQFGPDATPGAWAESLLALQARTDLQLFAPGHGAPVDRGFLELQLADIAHASASVSGPEAPARSALSPIAWVPDDLPAGVRRLR